MARNRHKKSQVKAGTRAIEHTTSEPTLPSPLSKPSATVQKVVKRIASGGMSYLMKNAERIMIGSARLADEPEFADLFLNRDQAVKVTERWYTKYEKRLKEAERKGKDEYQQVFDDMRIEIIDELATPAFRNDVKKRLQAMNDRLMVTSDDKKIEMVMILQPLLDMKDIPWGLCGLIITIYSRTMEKEMKAFQEENEIFEALTEAIKKDEGEEKIDFIKIMKSPNKLEQLSQKIFGKNPGLRERVEKQIWKRVDEFEEELAKGEIALDLFTEEELLLPLQRLQEELEAPVTEAQPGNELTNHVFDAIRQTINDIMTPERYKRLRKDVESTAKAWMRQRNKWAASLQAELTLLEDTYEENPFLLHAFFGQIRRSTRKQKTASKSKQ